jgi:hypothetical protein
MEGMPTIAFRIFNCFGEGKGREHLSKAVFNVLSVLKSTIRGFEKESASFSIRLDMWVLELHEFVWSCSSNFSGTC